MGNVSSCTISATTKIRANPAQPMRKATYATVSNPRNTRINGQFILHASSPDPIKLNLTALCARRNDYTLRRMIHEARKKRRRMTFLVARTQVQTLVHAGRSDSMTLTLFLQVHIVLTSYPRYAHVTLRLHSDLQRWSLRSSTYKRVALTRSGQLPTFTPSFC